MASVPLDEPAALGVGAVVEQARPWPGAGGEVERGLVLVELDRRLGPTPVRPAGCGRAPRTSTIRRRLFEAAMRVRRRRSASRRSSSSATFASRCWSATQQLHRVVQIDVELTETGRRLRHRKAAVRDHARQTGYVLSCGVDLGRVATSVERPVVTVKGGLGSDERALGVCDALFRLRHVSLGIAPFGRCHGDLPFGVGERTDDLVALLHHLA